MRRVTVVAMTVAALAGCVAPTPPGGPPDAPSFAFTVARVDSVRDATEPSLLVDPIHEALFVSALSGLLPPRAGGGQSYLWRSTDAGAT